MARPLKGTEFMGNKNYNLSTTLISKEIAKKLKVVSLLQGKTMIELTSSIFTEWLNTHYQDKIDNLEEVKTDGKIKINSPTPKKQYPQICNALDEHEAGYIFEE